MGSKLIVRSNFKKKYGTGLKIGGALALGGPNPLMFDKDVLGARGSIKSPGRSVDQAKDKKISENFEVEQKQKQDAAAAAAAAEEPFNIAKESQRKALLRKGRRASILTSSQGVTEPLGLPG